MALQEEYDCDSYAEGCLLLQLEELQKVKIPTSIRVTPTRGGLLDNWD